MHWVSGDKGCRSDQRERAPSEAPLQRDIPFMMAYPMAIVTAPPKSALGHGDPDIVAQLMKGKLKGKGVVGGKQKAPVALLAGRASLGKLGKGSRLRSRRGLMLDKGKLALRRNQVHVNRGAGCQVVVG